MNSPSTTPKLGFGGKFTHFVNDPDDPATALAFKAYLCMGCRRLHLISRVSRVPWILAATDRKMRQISDIPVNGCYTGKANLQEEDDGKDNRKEAEDPQDHHENAG